jgi:hypothetical protein
MSSTCPTFPLLSIESAKAADGSIALAASKPRAGRVIEFFICIFFDVFDFLDEHHGD